MVVIDGINYPDGTYKDEYGNVILPDGTKCVDVKVALGESEQQEIENRMAENTLKKTAGGSPNRAFATLDELKQALPEGVVIPAEDYSSPYRGTKLVRENQHVYFYNTNSQWEDWGVYQGTMVSPDDPIIVDVRGDIQAVQDNLDLHINDANAKFSAIDTHQDFQDKKLDNHNDRLNDLEDIIHETAVTEVEDDFTGSKINVPTSVEIDGRNFGVIDNQLFKVSKILGNTRKSENLISYPFDEKVEKPKFQKVINGVTWTSFDDGTLTATGTATGGDSVFNLALVDAIATGNAYIYLSGCPEGGSPTSYYLGSQDASDIRFIDTGEGKAIKSASIGKINITAVIKENYSISSKLIFMPMVNAGYQKQPFIKGFKGIQSAAIKKITSVGSNRIPYPYAEDTKTENGVTFIVNKDGTILVNGTATKDTTFNLGLINTLALSKEYVYLSGCPKGENNNNYFMGVLDTEFIDYGEGVAIKTVSAGRSIFKIVIKSGYTANNLLFKPMLNIGLSPIARKPYVADSTIELQPNQLTLKGVNDAYDEAILTKTSGSELYEVDILKRTIEIELGKLLWVDTGSYTGTYRAETPKDAKVNLNFICSNYVSKPMSGYAEQVDKTIMMRADYIAIKDTSLGLTPEQFKKYLADNNVKLVYELLAPKQEPKIKGLTLGNVSVMGQKNGEFEINSINDNIVEPRQISFKFDVKYWTKPTNEGGNL